MPIGPLMCGAKRGWTHMAQVGGLHGGCIREGLAVKAGLRLGWVIWSGVQLGAGLGVYELKTSWPWDLYDSWFARHVVFLS